VSEIKMLSGMFGSKRQSGTDNGTGRRGGRRRKQKEELRSLYSPHINLLEPEFYI